MRIAQIAPLHEAVPPKFYGGTERVVSYLTDALVDLGHDVTLFASGDSQTKATLEAAWPRALRLDPSIRDALAPHMLLLESVRQRAHEFDVLHFHLDYMPFSLFSQLDTPFVTTLHGRLDLPELQPIFNTFTKAPVISISDSQRLPLPQAAWLNTIYHGLPENLLTPQTHKKPEYLAFLGRICPEKRADLAIKIAAQSGLPLKIAAKVDKVDQEYFKIDDRAAAVAGARGIRRRDQRGAEAGVPVGCEGAAVPDRLVGAVRPGDDRGDGVRHAGDRVQSRLGAGSDRPRRDRLYLRRRAGRGRRAATPR